jgi:hypothetical protein
MTSRGMQTKPASQNIPRETGLPTNSHRFDAYLFTMLRCLECPLKNSPQIRHTCKREVLIVSAAANTGRKRIVHLREPAAGIRSVRNPDAVHMREIFGDFPRAIHERMFIRLLHLEAGWEVWKNRSQHQHGATLVFLPQQGGQLQTRARKVNIMNVQVLFQHGIKLQESGHFRTAGAEEWAFSVVEEVWFQEIQLITVHNIFVLQILISSNF